MNEPTDGCTGCHFLGQPHAVHCQHLTLEHARKVIAHQEAMLTELKKEIGRLVLANHDIHQTTP